MNIKLLLICHGCDNRQKVCRGKCVCTIDEIDILEHARQEVCPSGKYDSPAQEARKPESLQPIPFQEWPEFAKRIYGEREIPTDKGVGDTVHRRLGDGGIIFAAWVALLGIPCGCQQRRDDWNMLYPYGDK